MPSLFLTHPLRLAHWLPHSKSLHERWGPKKLDNTYKAMDVAMASMKRRLMTIIVPIIVLFFAFVVWYVRK